MARVRDADFRQVDGEERNPSPRRVLLFEKKKYAHANAPWLSRTGGRWAGGSQEGWRVFLLRWPRGWVDARAFPPVSWRALWEEARRWRWELELGDADLSPIFIVLLFFLEKKGLRSLARSALQC